MNGFVWEIILAIPNWTEAGLSLAVQAGYAAAPLAGIVLLVCLCFPRQLTAGQKYFLWGLVLLRLLVPVAPSSMMSMQNPLAQVLQQSSRPSDTSAIYMVSDNAHNELKPVAAPLPAVRMSATEQVSFHWRSIVAMSTSIVWLAGAAFVFFGTLIQYWLFSRRLRCIPIHSNDRLTRLVDHCRQLAGVQSAVQLKIFNGAAQPAVTGFWKPTLLIPSDVAELNDEKLRLIILHELAHVRRGDIAVNWLQVVIRALHWWNPIYWLAASKVNLYREQACDANVMEWTNGNTTRDYFDLLLQLAQRGSARGSWRVMVPALMLQVVSKKRMVKQRLTALFAPSKRQSRFHRIAVATLLLAFAASGMTDAIEQSPEPLPNNLTPSGGKTWKSLEGATKDRAIPQPDLPLVERSYDVSRAVDQIHAEGYPKEEVLLFLRATLIQPGVRYELPVGSAISGAESGIGTIKQYFFFDGEILTLRAPLSIHENFADKLFGWETSGSGQIVVSCHVITSSEDLALREGIDWQSLEAFSSRRDDLSIDEDGSSRQPAIQAREAVDRFVPIATSLLTENQAIRFLNGAPSIPRSNTVQWPKVTLLNGQIAKIVSGDQVPFVVGTQKSNAGVSEPRTVVLQEGYSATLRTVIAKDRSQVRLTGQVEFSKIENVATASANVTGKPATIQIPSVNRLAVELDSLLRPHEPLLIGCWPTPQRKEFLYFLIDARVLDVDLWGKERDPGE